MFAVGAGTARCLPLPVAGDEQNAVGPSATVEETLERIVLENETLEIEREAAFVEIRITTDSRA